jgi:hypothetical protein
VLTGPRKHQQLAVSRRLTYFGFELETDIEPLGGVIPPQLRDAARLGLARALLEGETPHPDQGRIRRAAATLREWWRRSGGTLEIASDAALLKRLLAQLEGMETWKQFLETPLALEPEAMVAESERRRLDALPSMIRLRGDAVPLDYEIAGGEGVVRLRLREGQGRRLSSDELPELDRPLRFAVVRGGVPPLRADSLPELRQLLAQAGDRAHQPRHRHPSRRGDRRR